MGTLTHKQGGMLFRLTLRKFWECRPAPTIEEASHIISDCLDAVRLRTAAALATAVRTVRKWFADFSEADLKPRFGGGRKGNHSEPAPQAEPEPVPEPDPDVPPEPDNIPPEPEPVPVPEPEEEPPAEPVKPKRERKPKPVKRDLSRINGNWEDHLDAFLTVGHKCILVVGPSQCGKSTVAMTIGAKLGRPTTMIPCNLGTPAYTFTGRRHPISGAYEETEFVIAYREGHVVVLDEVDRLDPGVAAVLNAALANGHLATPNGPIARHSEFRVIATSNTLLGGADRMYVAANQQDAAFAQRFDRTVLADYSGEWEQAHINAEVLECMGLVRAHIADRKLRKLCTTKQGLTATLDAEGGIPKRMWAEQFTINWSETEKQGLRL